MRILAAVFGLLILTAPARADDAEDILDTAADLFGDAVEQGGQSGSLLSGYVENSFRVLQKRDSPWDWRVQDAGKMKLRIDAKSGDLHVHGEISALYYAGLAEISVSEFVPDDVGVGGTIPFENSIEIAQAYASVPVGPIQMIVGRQPLALGTGYAWNPVDPFSEKDRLDPTYEASSHDAIKISLPLPLNGLAQTAAMVGPAAESLNDTSAFAAVRIHIAFDWEASFATHFLGLPDGTPLGREHVAGLATSGQIGELGIHGEAAWILSDFRRDHGRALLGGDYTFAVQNTVLLEGLFDQTGVRTGDYAQEDWVAYAEGRTPVLGQFYLFASSTQTILDVAEVELAAMANLSDFSVLLMPAVLVSFSEILELRLTGLVPFGRGGDEFGVVPVEVGLRVTAYF